jgi:putative membrane-bound dehydrogenase-like protein
MRTIAKFAQPRQHPIMCDRVFLLPLCALLLACGAQAGAPNPSRIELHPALEIHLFASEPDVIDPVALCFDAAGRMFVVEMRDYPYGVGPDRRPGGAIRLLEDRSGDGRADYSSIFAEGISFPTSITPWKDGVLVTAPPEILYLKDTTGDGRADHREVWFRGFRLGVTDSNANGLRFALDNHIHGVNGGNGGTLESPLHHGPAVPLGNLDFRFDARTGQLETTYASGRGFGLVFDDWGRSFTTYNIDHIKLRVLPVRYLQRHPGFPPLNPTHSISDHGEMARIHPVSVAQTRPNHPEQAGYFSAAGGMGFIAHPAYPGDLRGSVLVCDVVGNLVHRDVLHPDGPIFIASRSPDETNREFLASHDIHFRPVGLEPGPDGALYLIDMQREVIEHPDYIPARMRDQLDLRAGDQRGRIYRITPKSGLPTAPPPPARLDPERWVDTLAHENPWQRLTAQRLLIESSSRSVQPNLERMATAHGSPQGRLHALWTLHGLEALSESVVLHSLDDPHPGVRENAMRIAESFLPGTVNLRRALLDRASDPDPRVRFQTALTLGQFDRHDPAATATALRQILDHDLDHRWSRLAVLSSLASGERAWLNDFLQSPSAQTAGPSAIRFIEELADLAGARTQPSDAAAWTQLLANPTLGQLPKPARMAFLRGWQSGLRRANPQWPDEQPLQAALERLTRNASLQLQTEIWQTQRLLGMSPSESQTRALNRAAREATDPSLPLERRIAAARLSALGEPEQMLEPLVPLLTAFEPLELQEAVLDTLREFHHPAVAQGLIAQWRVMSPALRPRVVTQLLQRRSYHATLLDAIEDGRVRLGELNLDLEQRRRLLRWSTPDIHARAAQFIDDGEYGNRSEQVDEWLAKLPAQGDPTRGRPIFELACASCHVAGDLGYHVGPDLTGLAHRSVEDLLSHILDPNMAINPAYQGYHVETVDDDILTGIIEAQTAESITLLQAFGIRAILPRDQILHLEAADISLMPEGLETGLSPQDLRDLIAFLQERR